MKLFSFSFLYLILIVSLLISATFSLKHRAHHKTHRLTNKRKIHGKKATPLFFRFMEKNVLSQDQPSADSSDSSQNQTAGSNSSALILKEGWLRISSQSLYDRKKYPLIPLSKQNFAKVEVFRHNLDNPNPNPFYTSGYPYRKNSHFGGSISIPSQDSFWFRISGSYLYYTEHQTDMVVLGAIAVSNIQGTNPSSIGSNCFHIHNLEKDQWDLCASNEKEKEAWICAISQSLGRPCTKSSSPIVIEEKHIIKQPILLIPLPSPSCNEDWNYTAHGGDWNCKCSEGFQQSPINVDRRCAVNANQTASFSYSKVSTEKVTGYYQDNMFVIKCKKSLSKEECEEVSFGTIIDMDYAEYSCNEIRFHTPGEHTIGGRKYEMEIQFIYHPISEGDYKKKAGLVFLAQQKPGKINEFFNFMEFLDLPNIYKETMDFKNNMEIDIEKLFQDVDDEFEYNGYFSYWRYDGSLTSPPCDEHVRWFIVDKVINIGYTALEMMKGVLTIPQMSSNNRFVADLRYPPNPDGNNRDIQPIREREIFYFDMKNSDCVPFPKRKNKSSGHYEKFTKKLDTYVYVAGEKPSGIDGALVVPKWEAFGNESPEEQRERDINNIFTNTE